MLPGSQRDRIQVFAETKIKNAVNERVSQHSHAFYDRAEINFVSGDRELVLGAEMVGKVNTFKVHFAVGRYVETMVILWRDDYYLINRIEADSRRTYLYITGTRAMPGTIKIV